MQNIIGKISYVEKVQDVQDRSVDNKVAVVINEFQKEADNKLEEVEETKKIEMVIIENKEHNKKNKEDKNKNKDKKNKKGFIIPEEDDGKIIDLKG